MSAATCSEESLFRDSQSTPLSFEVSGFRKVILAYGADRRLHKRWAYGQQWRTPNVTGDGIRVAPHREFYTDADAQAVAEYVNGMVSP